MAMIEIKDAVLVNEDGEASAPLNFLKKKGLEEVPFADQSLYTALSFSFIELKSGSIAIDSSLIGPKENQGSLFLLDVACKGVMNLSAVFAFKEEEAKEKRKTIGEKIKSLKSMPTSSTHEKKLKINALFSALVELQASYVLLDYNEKINAENKTWITRFVYAYLNQLPIVVLSRDPKAKKVSRPRAEPQEPKNVSIAPSQEPKGPNKFAQACLYFLKATANFYKISWLDLLLMLGFSAFDAIGMLLMGSLFSTGGNTLSAVIFLIIGIIFFAEAIYFMTIIKMPESKKDIFIAEIGIAFNILLGLGVGFLVVYILSLFSVVVPKGGITLNGSTTAIIMGCILLVAPYFSQPLGKFFGKIASLFKKNKDKKK